MTSILRGLVYSNLFVAVVLAVLTWSTYLQFEDFLEFRYYNLASVFFGSFLLYNFHRLYKIDYIPENQLAKRHMWVLERERALKWALAGCLFVLMLLLPNYNADTVVALIPAGLISLGYTIPIIPANGKWSRFRDIPFVKPLIISVVVTYLTFAFPVFDQYHFSQLVNLEFATAFCERLMFTLAVTIPFDMRDMTQDANAGIETLATGLGFRKTQYVVYSALIIWSALFMTQHFMGQANSALSLCKIMMLGLLLILVFRLNQGKSDLYYVFAFEGAILCYGLAYAFENMTA